MSLRFLQVGAGWERQIVGKLLHERSVFAAALQALSQAAMAGTARQPFKSRQPVCFCDTCKQYSYASIFDYQYNRSDYSTRGSSRRGMVRVVWHCRYAS